MVADRWLVQPVAAVRQEVVQTLANLAGPANGFAKKAKGILEPTVGHLNIARLG
jgi:hypothetical protein